MDIERLKELAGNLTQQMDEAGPESMEAAVLNAVEAIENAAAEAHNAYTMAGMEEEGVQVSGQISGFAEELKSILG